MLLILFAFICFGFGFVCLSPAVPVLEWHLLLCLLLYKRYCICDHASCQSMTEYFSFLFAEDLGNLNVTSSIFFRNKDDIYIYINI